MDYLLTNVFTTLLLIVTVKIISQSPAKLQLGLLTLALINWFIPWHKIKLFTAPIPEILPNHFENLVPQLNDFFGPAKVSPYLSLNPSVEPTLLEQIQHLARTLDFGIIFIVLTLVGLTWFLVDVVRYFLYLRYLSSQATQDNSIFEQHNFSNVLPFNRKTKLKISPEAPTAMATGTLLPTIWINSQTLKSPQLNSILLHELTHLKQLDPTLKWLTQIAKRIFWWNPLVLLLVKKIDLLIEMRCDQHCFTVKHESYSIDLAEIILNHNKPNQPAVVYASGFTSIHSQTSQNMMRLQSLSTPKNMNKKFVGVATFGILLSTLVCAQINSTLLNNNSTSTYKVRSLHEKALSLQAHRAKQKEFQIYLADTPENADYNREIDKLVLLSKVALSPDKAVLNSIFSQIVDWNNQRPKLPPKQENMLQFHTFAVQNFLLQQQQKNTQIVDLVIQILGSLDSVPRVYLNRTISALVQQHNYEQAVAVVNQINFDATRVSISDVYLATTLYMLRGEYEQALQLINHRLSQENSSDTARLLIRKYQILAFLGDSQAEQIKQVLADEFNIKKIPRANFAEPKPKVHWAPVLDYI